MSRFITSLFAASDEQAMWRVKMQDDSQAFARLVSRWEGPIQRLCARMTGDPHRAEDLTQTTFARVFARRADWEPAGKFSTFLWRIAVNLCHDELRNIKRRGECSLEALEDGDGNVAELFAADEPAPDVQADARERGDQVRRAMQELPAHYRAVVVLRHYEQLKFHEIAEVLGIPEGTAKSRMAEALSQLNRRLRHLNEDTPCNHRIPRIELQAL
jgi:RNA polymerase sigma-70 factor (ECF subfamily)